MNKEDVIVFKFDVFHLGWECDSVGWIMKRKDGSRYIKLTNHGGEYIADVSELEERIETYKKAIFDTETAIFFFKG